jgi:hypothetical protein
VKNQWTALREKQGWAPSELANSVGASKACHIAQSLDANVTEFFSRVTRRPRLEGLAARQWCVRLLLRLSRVFPTKTQERASAAATPRPRPNLTAPRHLFSLDYASRLRHSPHPQVFATNDKRHGSGEPSGFTGFSLRAGRTGSCFLGYQMQTPPREGHQWSQIHSS